jgi:segregation and condensation protein B
MSLKAKIEAVVYASEEPVTLVQLAGLLGQEAQAELDALAARQATLQMVEGAAEPVDSPDSSVEETHASFASVGHPVGADPIATQSAEESPAEKRAARERERKVREYLREQVEELIRDYRTSDRGLEIKEVAGGFRMATKPEYHDAVRGFVKSLKPPLKLSLQALETLAVVAYKQPVTAPEVSEIRGVDSGGVLGSLMARKLITTAGRKQVIGRPILYKTTKDFLLRFGLKDVAELPSIEEFEKMAGELADAEPVQEEIPMPEPTESTEERITHENLLEEQHATEPQADGDSEDLEPEESNRPSDELPAVDGRESGLPPTYDRPGDDPSADEAAIQSGQTDVVATPEGDNEISPDEPLEPSSDAAVIGLETPLGSKPDGYKEDKA